MIGTTRRRMYGSKAKEAYLCQRSTCTLDTGVPDYKDLEFEIRFILFDNNRKSVIYSKNVENNIEFINNSDGTVKYENYTLNMLEPYTLEKKISANKVWYTWTINGTNVKTSYSHSDLADGTIKISYHIYNWRDFHGGIAYLKISRNGELLFDGIPKEVNGVCGLWDNVTGQLFANSNESAPNNTYTIEYF